MPHFQWVLNVKLPSCIYQDLNVYDSQPILMSYSNGTRYFSMILLEETSRSREPSGGNLQTLQSKWWPSLEMFLKIGQHSATIPALHTLGSYLSNFSTRFQNNDCPDVLCWFNFIWKYKHHSNVFRSQTAQQNQDKADKKAKSEDECTLGNVGNKDGDHISNEHRMSNYQLVFIKI